METGAVPIRIKSQITTPLRVLALFVTAVLSVIIILHSD